MPKVQYLPYPHDKERCHVHVSTFQRNLCFSHLLYYGGSKFLWPFDKMLLKRRRNTSKGSKIRSYNRENLKSHQVTTSYKEFDTLLSGDKLTASFSFVLGLEVTKSAHVSDGKQVPIVCRPSACPVTDVVLEDTIKRTLYVRLNIAIWSAL